MSAQFYVCWDINRKEELICFVQQKCAMEMLPMLKPLKYPFNNGEAVQKGFIFVREEDKKQFQYKASKDEQGNLEYMLGPINLVDNMPCYIECSCGNFIDERIYRFYLPTLDPAADGTFQAKHTFKQIRKWVADNCTLKKKIDSIWMYII